MNICVKEGCELMAIVRPRRGNYNYAIIHRLNVDDYVFCSGYDVHNGTWCQGYYMETYQNCIAKMAEYLEMDPWTQFSA